MGTTNPSSPLRDEGMVLGYGCGSPGATRTSQYPQQAYQLGRSLA